MSSHAESPGEGRVTLTPTALSEVDPTDEVRHVDQLTDRARRVVAAAPERRPARVRAPSLSGVDVVVSATAYRVD
jgi:hypothetical protein